MASAFETPAIPEDFFASFSQSPGDCADCDATQSCQACWDLKARTGKSRLALTIPPTALA
jgi:hypothetical protein